MTTQALQGRTEEQEWKYAGAAMAWYGWGSPIGFGIFLVCAAGTIALLRYSFLG
jgi:hypothetical protein